MKCTIPEISWHNRDPILSVDIQNSLNEGQYRLASGGTDCHVLIWHMKIRNNGGVDAEAISDLKRHQRAVNVVRWSPSGQYLASGDDDANIIIWNLKTDNIPLLEGDTLDKETWVVYKVLRGHREDVYDVCWSPNELKLISGSIDNTAMLWDLNKGLNEHILSDHKGFVQGVTWDPKSHYIATLSSDRICRIFDSSGKVIKARAFKGTLPLPETHSLYQKECKYFHDDTFKSYFRRLTFSPDGNLLFTPSGCIENNNDKGIRHTTLVFTLSNLTQPVAILPSPKQITIAVRCCPILFELNPDGVDPIIVLPYRMVIAVATDTDIILYDTQQLTPFAHLQKVHYTRITDLTWSPDGLLLIASSTDGYCTLVTFQQEELGKQYVKEESEAETNCLDNSGFEEVEDKNGTSVEKEVEHVEVKSKKPNILEKWAIKGSVSKKNGETLEENVTTSAGKGEEPVQSCTRRRIVPMRILDLDDKKAPKKEANENEVIIIEDDKDESPVHCAEEKEGKPAKDDKKRVNEQSPLMKRRKSSTPAKNSTSLLKFFKGANSKNNKPVLSNELNGKQREMDDKVIKITEDKKNETEAVCEVIELSDDDGSRETVKNIYNSTEVAKDLTASSENALDPIDHKHSPNTNLSNNIKIDNTQKINETTSLLTSFKVVEETAKAMEEQSRTLDEKENHKKEEVVISMDVDSGGTKMENNEHPSSLIPSTSTYSKPTLKTPRRVALVTLSSPKRKRTVI